MKRVWAVILAAVLALSLTACGKEESGTGGKLTSGTKSADQADIVETPELASLRENITGSSENGEWLLSDDETDIRIATELLCEADEVRDYISLGMSVQYTGEHVMVDGRECRVFALGTEHEDQFVREIFYAVCDNLIYRYDPIDDAWTALTGEAAFGSAFTLADMEGTWQAVSSLDVSYPDQEPTPLNGTPVTLVLESHWDTTSDTTTLTGEYRENWGNGAQTESGLTAEVRSGGMNGICPNQAWFVELCHRESIWLYAALTDWDAMELQVYHPDTAASVIYTCKKAGGGAG